MLDFVPIRPDYFHIGMHIEGNVYYLAGTQYNLIFGDRIVDKELRDNLFRIAAKTGVLYVLDIQAEKIMRQGTAFDQIRSNVEKTVGYQTLLSNTTRIFDKMRNTNKLDLITIDVLVQQLQEKINTVPHPSIIQSINLLESDISYLYRHSINVALINGLMASWLNLSEEETRNFIYGGLLHDIGKLKVPENILIKPDKLTDDEYAVMKKHPLFSYEILRNAGIDNETVLQCALYHHERIRGDGYPKQLTLEQIPLVAKVTSIADSYDAMVSNRFHKNALSPFDILQEFSNDKYSRFDITVMNVLLAEFSRNLVGRDVLLSDGSIAKVKFIRENDYAHPLIEYNGELVQTNEHLRPICMCG